MWRSSVNEIPSSTIKQTIIEGWYLLRFCFQIKTNFWNPFRKTLYIFVNNTKRNKISPKEKFSNTFRNLKLYKRKNFNSIGEIFRNLSFFSKWGYRNMIQQLQKWSLISILPMCSSRHSEDKNKFQFETKRRKIIHVEWNRYDNSLLRELLHRSFVIFNHTGNRIKTVFPF